MFLIMDFELIIWVGVHGEYFEKLNFHRYDLYLKTHCHNLNMPLIQL
jgi:hypothetical protein